MILSNTNGVLHQRFGFEKATEMLKEAGFDAIDMDLCGLEKDNCIFWDNT